MKNGRKRNQKTGTLFYFYTGGEKPILFVTTFSFEGWERLEKVVLETQFVMNTYENCISRRR